MDVNRLSIEGRARIDILNAAHRAGRSGAHIAPSLSDVDICLSILTDFDEKKDSFVLSKGHGALGYYAAMHQLKMITDSQFDSFESNGGEFPGQPSRSPHNKVEYSSGSLGMGMSYALGLSLAKNSWGAGKPAGLPQLVAGCVRAHRPSAGPGRGHDLGKSGPES